MEAVWPGWRVARVIDTIANIINKARLLLKLILSNLVLNTRFRPVDHCYLCVIYSYRCQFSAAVELINLNTTPLVPAGPSRFDPHM